jgi:hypothetical protein
LNARGFSVSGNAAYRQNLANQWFIEPSAGITWSRTNVDQLNMPGTVVPGATLPALALTINDIYTTLGRFSVRVGTTVRTNNMVLQPFASAGIFHELQGGATSSLASNSSAAGTASETYSSVISTSGFGTYGQFGVGVAAQFPSTGWVSYLRGDYRKGDNVDGWTLNGGVRYQF